MCIRFTFSDQQPLNSELKLANYNKGDKESSQSYGCCSVEIVKSVRLSPKNQGDPIVEVLHFKKEKDKNKYNKFMSKNKNDTKLDASIPSLGTYVTDNSEFNKPLMPKKLSFNSWSSSTDTPEK